MTALEKLKKFQIYNELWNPSDHTPVSVSFKMNVVKEDCSVATSIDLLTEAGCQGMLKPQKF